MLAEPPRPLDGRYLPRGCLPGLRQLVKSVAGGTPEEDKAMPYKKLSRNAPCPCGSGRKY